MIPLTLLARYAVPFIVGLVHWGDPEFRQQILEIDRISRLSDEVLSKGKGEGLGNETFDYIIVGAGSAGAVLANRLSASGQDTVLLLEAGGDPSPVTDIPIGNQKRQGLMDWGYKMERQERVCQKNNGVN